MFQIILISASIFHICIIKIIYITFFFKDFYSGMINKLIKIFSKHWKKKNCGLNLKAGLNSCYLPELKFIHRMIKFYKINIIVIKVKTNRLTS